MIWKMWICNLAEAYSMSIKKRRHQPLLRYNGVLCAMILDLSYGKYLTLQMASLNSVH